MYIYIYIERERDEYDSHLTHARRSNVARWLHLRRFLFSRSVSCLLQPCRPLRHQAWIRIQRRLRSSRPLRHQAWIWIQRRLRSRPRKRIGLELLCPGVVFNVKQLSTLSCTSASPRLGFRSNGTSTSTSASAFKSASTGALGMALPTTTPSTDGVAGS